MDGDEELLLDTIEIFLEAYPKILAALHTAIQDQDAKTVEREAHPIKGAVSNLGQQEHMNPPLVLKKSDALKT